MLHGFLAEPPGNPRRFCSSSPRLSSTAINYYVRLDGGRKKRVFRVRGGGRREGKEDNTLCNLFTAAKSFREEEGGGWWAPL